jgi:hypothetical protein
VANRVSDPPRHSWLECPLEGFILRNAPKEDNGWQQFDLSKSHVFQATNSALAAFSSSNEL